MKRISLSILIATLILSLGLGTVYAATITASSAALGTGTITIAYGSATTAALARQTADISFTTSVNVYLAVVGSSATLSENYVVSGAHLSGDKAYAVASSGGGVYWIAKTAGTATFTSPATIGVTGTVNWGSYAAM